MEDSLHSRDLHLLCVAAPPDGQNVGQLPLNEAFHLVLHDHLKRIDTQEAILVEQLASACYDGKILLRQIDAWSEILLSIQSEK